MANAQPEKVYHKFYASRPRITIVREQGQRIFFNAGMYVTDNPDEVAFLQAEIKRGNRMIYTKTGEETVTQDQLDPMNALRKKIIEEYEANRAAQQNGTRDLGTVEAAAGVAPATTKSIAPVVAGSISVGSKAK
jgi:hypothetical protein